MGTLSTLSRLCLLVLTPVGVFMSAALEARPVQATVTFSDEFDRSGLGADWTWENHGGSSAYAVSGNLFNLVVTPNNDQWAGIDRGARILRAQRDGSWTI